MALINTLREKAGKVLVIAVGLAIVSFILADLMGPNSMIFGGNNNQVGEISGRKITYEDFQRRIEDMKNNYMLNTGRNPSEAEMVTIRQQAWELLIVDIAFEEEYEKLGIVVSDEEKIDMVQGNNIHPDLVRAFTNPETGMFDKNEILNFLQNFSLMPPQNQYQWTQMEQNIYQARKRLKYDNLFLTSNFITDAEAIEQYKAENSTADVEYLYVPFYSVSDSSVTVSDRELQSYLDKNKALYQVEESRGIAYVAISIAPAAADTAYYKAELERLANEFRSVETDSSFARLNSDFGQPYGTFRSDQLPEALSEQYEDLEEGQVVGPLLENGAFTLYKVSRVMEDSTFKIAAINREISASNETRDAAFRRADYFAGISSNENQFHENAKAESLVVMEANNIDASARRVGSLLGAREVVRWLFNDASKGKVSEVFELDEAYVVAVMTEKVDKGTASLASVRDEVTVKVKNEKKGTIIINKLQGLSGSLGEIAGAYGDDAHVYTTSDLKLNSNSLPNVGFAPMVVGTAFGLEAGQTSDPVLAENGVVVIKTNVITEAAEIGDYTAYKSRLKQTADNMVSFKISSAIKEFAEIEDTRYKFY